MPSRKKKEQELAKQRRFIALVVVLCAGVVSLIVLGACSAMNASAASVTEATAIEETTVSESAEAGDVSLCHFYAREVQNGNFGPSAVHEGWTATDYWKELVRRMKGDDQTGPDPSLGAAIMCYTKAMTGYDPGSINSTYVECGRDWELTINTLATRWAYDLDEYYQELNVWISYLTENGVIALDTNARQCTDQMFMVWDTSTGIPLTVVRHTTQGQGPWLVIQLTIKGNVATDNAGADGINLIYLRCPCGYQPSNVASIMNIAPKVEGVVPTVPTLPSGGGTPSTPTPPSPSTSYDCDPADSSSSGVSGSPGSETYTGTRGGNVSTWDTNPSNSGYDNSVSQYQQEIDANKAANEQAENQQKSGGAPSYTPPASSGGNTVDDNSISGGNTGGGSINNAPATRPQTDVTTGQTGQEVAPPPA